MKQYNIGDVYYYAAKSKGDKLKLYSIKICSGQDFRKGIIRSKSRGVIEQFIKDFAPSKPSQIFR